MQILHILAPFNTTEWVHVQSIGQLTKFLHRTTVITTGSGDLIVTVFSSLAILETCGLLKEYTTVNLLLAFHRRHPSSPPYWLFPFVLLLWQLALASRWIKVKHRLDEIPKFYVTMFTVVFDPYKKVCQKKLFVVKRYVLKRRTNYNKTDNTTRHVSHGHKRGRWNWI